ncbi:MAG: glycine zipper 2TM domain-containing protein [Sphingorhabdus sp.]
MQIKNSIGAMVLAATAMTGVMATPAEAHRSRHHHNHDSRYDDGYSGRDDYRGRYDRRTHYRQRCDRGRGGTIIGAIAGGLLGNEVARRGDKTEGTIIGAAVGAIAGRAIDKANNPCRRRYRRR